MGITGKEQNFPRGGRKPDISLPKKEKFNLFRLSSRKESRLKRSSKKPKSSHKRNKNNTALQLSHVTPLSKESLTEGMLILGCITGIDDYSISVSLPGRISGKVAVTNISVPYTQCLHNLVEKTNAENILHLNQMFKVGQYVVTRVLSIGDKVELSIMPDVVQSNLSAQCMKVGYMIVAAVKSCEDNGYIMDTGIKNVRAFLKSHEASQYESLRYDGKPLGIGELVKCVVLKCNISSSIATVELSADPRKVCKPTLFQDEGFTMDTLLPGTVLNISVTEILSNGLKVACGEHLTAYVYKDDLSDLWHTVHDYSPGDVYQAIILYIKPVINFVHVSLKKELFSFEQIIQPSSDVKLGDIVKNAEVVEVGNNYGVTLKLHKKYKGIVPLFHCSESKTDSDEEIDEKYQVGSQHCCRIIGYDYITHIFTCTFRKSILNAEYLFPVDLMPGMKVICHIKEYVETGAVVAIAAGERFITGFVRKEHIGNVPLSNPEKKFPIGSKHFAMVLEVEGNDIQLSLKSELVKSNIPPLHCLEDVRIGMECIGVVMLVKDDGLLVTFYNHLKGWLDIRKQYTPASFYVGQVLKCYVQTVDRSNNKIFLFLKGNEVKISNFQIGHPYRIVVTSCSESELEVEGECGRGIIPAQHLTDIPTLANLLLRTYSTNDVLESAYCFSNNQSETVFTLRPSLIEYFQSGGATKWSDVKTNDLIPSSVKKITESHLLLQMPLVDCNMVFVTIKSLHFTIPEVELVKHQGLISRVIKVGYKPDQFCVTVKLQSCWNYTIEPSLKLLHKYWEDHERIGKYLRTEENPLAFLKPGDKVRGKVISVVESGYFIKLKCGARAVVSSKLSGKDMKCGDEVRGTVIFVDYETDCCELTTKQCVMERINTQKDSNLAGRLDVGTRVRAKLLSIHSDIVTVSLRGIGMNQFAYIPTKRHINDLNPDLNQFKIVGKIHTLIVKSFEGGRITCVLKQQEPKLIKRQIRLQKKKEKRALKKLNSGERFKKRKTVTLDSSVGQKNKISEQVSECKDFSFPADKIDFCKNKETRTVKRNMKEVDEEEGKQKKRRIVSNGNSENLTGLSLSGGFVWDPKPTLLLSDNKDPECDGSSDDEQEHDKKLEKKKKLSRAERRAKARQEEERIRSVEQKLINSDNGPQSADDFDRLVLSSPDSSLCWIKYMAFHLQATEIEKARAVARRALNTISFREEQEKLNVWNALLSLENLYGTKESLEKVLEEAVRMNDPLKVYLQMLQIYSDSKKIEEAEKLVSMLIKKFRDNKDAWVHGGEVLLKLGRLEKARSLMQKALTNLEKKLHVEVITKFAQMENQVGEPERAQTLMEHILTSYPKRLDIWNVYVDMLVKNRQYDAARLVLERGVAQKLPARKMKSLFLKFLQFEEKYGTSDGAAKVRRMAKDYVEKTSGGGDD